MGKNKKNGQPMPPFIDKSMANIMEQVNNIMLPNIQQQTETEEQVVETQEPQQETQEQEPQQEIPMNMMESRIVPYTPPLFDKRRPYIQIKINETGVILGAIAASISYTATQTTINAAGSATSIAVNTAGYILEKAVSLAAGQTAAAVIGLTANAVAATAKEGLQLQSCLAATAVSAAVGTTTALAVSASTSLISGGFSLLSSGASYIYSKLPSKETLYKYTGGFIKDSESNPQSSWDKVD
jgi:hypothetical protein